MPAEFTNPRIDCARSAGTRESVSRTAASSPMSARYETTLPPLSRSSSVAMREPSSISMRTTCQAGRMRRHTARPMPRHPPLTMAVGFIARSLLRQRNGDVPELEAAGVIALDVERPRLAFVGVERPPGDALDYLVVDGGHAVAH